MSDILNTTLTNIEFKEISSLIYKISGLDISNDKKNLIEHKLKKVIYYVTLLEEYKEDCQNRFKK